MSQNVYLLETESLMVSDIFFEDNLFPTHGEGQRSWFSRCF